MDADGEQWRDAIKKAWIETMLEERFQEKHIRAKTATDADDTGQNATEILGHENSVTTKIYIRSIQVKKVELLDLPKIEGNEDKASSE